MSSNVNVNEKEKFDNIIDGAKKTASTVYEGLGTLGIAYNIFKFIIVLIIFIIVIIIGYMLIKSYNNKIKITGKFSDISCNNTPNTTTTINTTNTPNTTTTTNTTNTTNQYSCTGYVIYNIDNKPYKKTYSVPYTISNNQDVVVYYNPSNPDDFIISNNKYYIGIAMIVISLLIIISSLFWTILSFKYKPVAAIEGASFLNNMIWGRSRF